MKSRQYEISPDDRAAQLDDIAVDTNRARAAIEEAAGPNGSRSSTRERPGPQYPRRRSPTDLRGRDRLWLLDPLHGPRPGAMADRSSRSTPTRADRPRPRLLADRRRRSGRITVVSAGPRGVRPQQSRLAGPRSTSSSSTRSGRVPRLPRALAAAARTAPSSSPTTSCGAAGCRDARMTATTRAPRRCRPSTRPSSTTGASSRRSCRSATGSSSRPIAVEQERDAGPRPSLRRPARAGRHP